MDPVQPAPLVSTPEGREKYYKGSLNLPQTDFPMMSPKAEERVSREMEIISRWDTEDLYDQIREARKYNTEVFRPKFTLHDGPPYANGDIHMGHAVNKVLKDIIVRFKTMVGFDAQFVPGWDCHGLPIEQAVQKDLKTGMPEPVHFRILCKHYADDYVIKQSEQFRSLGISADFKHPYLTTDRMYERGVLKLLGDLVQAGVVYRDKKPVHWCVKHKTALAEAELEYRDIEDESAYVRYDTGTQYAGESLDFVGQLEPWKIFARALNVRLMVWTTTPWTLPSNRAIAVNPDGDYVAVLLSNEPYLTIVGAEAASRLMSGQITSNPFKGSELVGMTYNETFSGTKYNVIGAPWVSQEMGTGLVHIAPGHGQDDFMLGKENGLEIYCGVDDKGNLADKNHGNVLGEASKTILGQLEYIGALWKREKITHSYPHCWRCHQKVIFRATEQWFIETKTGKPMNEMVRWYAQDTKWIPPHGRARFMGMLDRPDWCISRQRLWGIPIPYFIHRPTGEVIMTSATIRRVTDYFAKWGSNTWFTDTPEQILGADINGVKDFEKGADILDVWFESGASHESVLSSTEWGLQCPADLYLEGSDQHRGWFQSSMFTAFLNQKPPTKAFLTHGFVLDKDGRKMSKELGNVIKVSDAVNKYGVDIVRMWVASVDYTDDIKCSDELFRNTTEAYRKIRNTLRYLLSNLYDFTGSAITPGSIDHYIMDRADTVRNAVKAAYEAYDIKNAMKTVYGFCNDEISAFYAKAIKDRLYCSAADSYERKCAQTGCYLVLRIILEMLAPIAPVLCEEVWQSLRKMPITNYEKSLQNKSIHLTEWQRNDFPEVKYAGLWSAIYDLLPGAITKLDELKKTIGLNNTLDAELVIYSGNISAWDINPQEIEDALGVGHHIFVHSDTLSLDIVDTREKYPRCERSRKRRPDVGKNPLFPDLSLRDAEVVHNYMKVCDKDSPSVNTI